MHRRRMMVIIAAVGVLLALSVGIALAGAYDITTAGAEVDINGAIFRSFLVDDPTGTGYFDPFLRVNANTDIVQGYNTDYRPLEFDEDASWTESLPLSCLPTVSEEGVLYREVQLDINETKPQSILSLEEVEIYLTADPNLYPYPFNPASVTLVYDLDAGAENWVLLDYANNKGSGKRDMKLLVPDAFFGAYDPTCAYAGNAPACETTGCGEYVVLYSLFGGHETKATDGFEEWGVPVIDTPLGKIIVDKVTDPTGSPQEFDFVPDYTDPFTLTDEAAVNDSGWLLPDTYSVSETVPDGWDLTSSSCDDGSDPSAIGLDAGEVVTCIFTDTQRGKIIVDKVTVPGGSDQEFDFVPDYTDPFTLTDAADPNDSGWLLPDTYSVSETVPGGWDLTDSYCDDGSPVNAIVLDPGETVICTFEDTKLLGTLEVTKIVDWNGDEPDPSQTFEICIQGPSYPLGTEAGACKIFDYDGETLTWVDLIPGTYTVSETDPGVEWVVEIAGSPATVVPGETAYATVTNYRRYWGFTPGFWKNHTADAPSGHNAWVYTDYDPTMTLGSVFGTPPECVDGDLASKTLLDALEFKGGRGEEGAARILLRAGVAALLNASFSENMVPDPAPGGPYPYTVTEVIDQVNAALASCDRVTMIMLAKELDDFNNNGTEDIDWTWPAPTP